MPRTKQQKIGDRLEQAGLRDAKDWFSGAELTKGSGNVNQDGDLVGVPHLYVEFKNSDVAGKGRSISKKDWAKIRHQATRRCQIPVHAGFDDEGNIVALLPFGDLLALLHAAEKEGKWTT